MTITVAMALSGLEPEQWNDGLKEIYMQGAILFPKSPSTLSIASSGASSYYSLESGISSMSPDSASYLNQLIVNDLDGLGLDGIVQLQEYERKDDDGTLQNADESCQTVTGELSDEKPMRSIGLEPDDKQLADSDGDDDDDANKVLEHIEHEDEEEEEDEGMKPNKVYTQVTYQGRNMLNLFGNIRGGWKYQTSALPEGVNSFYFDNRSQYSRLQDAYPPKHAKVVCKEKDCGYVETIYF